MRSGLILAAIVAFGLGGQTCSADPITYNIFNDSADQNGWTVSGTIITDGKLGALGNGDISSWTLTETKGGTTYTATSGDTGASSSVNGTFTASATALTLGAVGTPGNSNSFGMSVTGGLSITWDRTSTGQEFDQYFSNSNGGANVLFGATNPTGFGSGTWTIATTTPASVPEPSSLVMCGLGGLGVALAAWRRRRAATA